MQNNGTLKIYSCSSRQKQKSISCIYDIFRGHNVYLFSSKSSDCFANNQKVNIPVKYLDFSNMFLTKSAAKLLNHSDMKKTLRCESSGWLAANKQGCC